MSREYHGQRLPCSEAHGTPDPLPFSFRHLVRSCERIDEKELWHQAIACGASAVMADVEAASQATISPEHQPVSGMRHVMAPSGSAAHHAQFDND